MWLCVVAYSDLVAMASTPLPDWEVKIAPPILALVPAHLLAQAVGPALLNPSTKHWVRVPSTDKYLHMYPSMSCVKFFSLIYFFHPPQKLSFLWSFFIFSILWIKKNIFFILQKIKMLLFCNLSEGWDHSSIYNKYLTFLWNDLISEALSLDCAFMDLSFAFQTHSLMESLWCGFQWLQARVCLRTLSYKHDIRQNQIWHASFVQVLSLLNGSLWNICRSVNRYKMLFINLKRCLLLLLFYFCFSFAGFF